MRCCDGCDEEFTWFDLKEYSTFDRPGYVTIEHFCEECFPAICETCGDYRRVCEGGCEE